METDEYANNTVSFAGQKDIPVLFIDCHAYVGNDSVDKVYAKTFFRKSMRREGTQVLIKIPKKLEMEKIGINVEKSAKMK